MSRPALTFTASADANVFSAKFSFYLFGNDASYTAFTTWVEAATGVDAIDTANLPKYDGYAFQIAGMPFQTNFAVGDAYCV